MVKFTLKTASFGAASALAVLLFANVPARAALPDASPAPNDQAVLVSARSGDALMVQGMPGNVNENLLQPVALMATLLLGMGGVIALRRRQLDMDSFQSISTDF
jgi:hypothetical protein